MLVLHIDFSFKVLANFKVSTKQICSYSLTVQVHAEKYFLNYQEIDKLV